jgi:PhnB protein
MALAGSPDRGVRIAPWLSVPEGSGANAVAFYLSAFGARVLDKLEQDGQVLVARLDVGGADFWLGESSDPSPERAKGVPVRMIVTVEDPDSLFSDVMAAGATELVPMNEEHGWRIGRLVDPFGHHWEIGRQLE